MAAWLNLGGASKTRKQCFTYETPREYSAVIIKFKHFDHKILSKFPQPFPGSSCMNTIRLRPEFRFTHEHWLVAVFQADRTFHGRSLLFFAKSPEGNSSADEQYLYFRWGISIAKLQYPVLLYKWLFFNPDTETGYGTLCYQHTLNMVLYQVL